MNGPRAKDGCMIILPVAKIDTSQKYGSMITLAISVFDIKQKDGHLIILTISNYFPHVAHVYVAVTFN